MKRSVVALVTKNATWIKWNRSDDHDICSGPRWIVSFEEESSGKAKEEKSVSVTKKGDLEHSLV
jgi:hypothetical protein